MSVCLIIGILYLHICLVKTETKVLYWENNNNTNFVYSIPSNNDNSGEKEFSHRKEVQNVVYFPLLKQLKENKVSKTNVVPTTVPVSLRVYNWLKNLLSTLTNFFSSEENQIGLLEKYGQLLRILFIS